MIRILTDSASDILPAEAEQLGVTVIPLNVTLEDGSILRDGIDMTPTEYYACLLYTSEHSLMAGNDFSVATHRRTRLRPFGTI